MENDFLQRTLQDQRVIVFARPRVREITSAGDHAGAYIWDVNSLTRAAIYFQPELEVARAHVQTLRAGEQTAGEMPNPSFTALPNPATNAGSLNPWIAAFTFDVPIETAGKREDRVAEAKSLTEAAQWDCADAVWRSRGNVRDALAEMLVDERAVTLYSQVVESRSDYVSMLTARLHAGEAARAEVDTAQVDLLTTRQAWRSAQGQLADARTKLAAAIGVPTAGLGDASFAWNDFENPPALDAFTEHTLQEAGLLNRLNVRRSLAEYDAAEAALKLEIAKQYPDVHLGPGYTFDQGQNEWQLGVTVTLPIFNQNGGAIAEAEGRRKEQAARFLALQAQVIGQVESATARYESAKRELDDADAQVTALDDHVKAGRDQLSAGEADQLMVRGLEIQRGVAALLRIDALRKMQAARNALEDAIERPLPPSAATQPSASKINDEHRSASP